MTHQKITNAKLLGETAERLAGEFLQAQGYVIVAKNYTVQGVGEIDLIVRKVGQDKCGKAFAQLVCVEVRARTIGKFGRAIDTITPTKQKRLIKTCLCFLQNHQLYQKDTVRFDVIAIDLPKQGDMVVNEQNWVRGAFLAE